MFNSDRHLSRASTFLATFMKAAMVMGLASLSLCWLIDPLGLLTPMGMSPGLCSTGTRVSNHRYLRPVIAYVHQPRDILLGSSRTLLAFNEDTFVAFTGQKAANLAVSSASLADIDKIVHETVAKTPIDRIWIGLDFGAFSHLQAPYYEDDPYWPIASRQLTALRFGLFEPQAFKAMVFLLVRPRDCFDPEYSALGFARRYAVNADQTGTAALPNANTRKQLLHSWEMPGIERERLYRGELHRLDRLLHDMNERGIKLVLFLTPSHPSYHALITNAGLQGLYYRWHNDVRRIAEQYNARLVMSDTPAFMDSIKAPGCLKDVPMIDCHFYDATHARPHVGDAIVRAALSSKG